MGGPEEEYKFENEDHIGEDAINGEFNMKSVQMLGEDIRSQLQPIIENMVMDWSIRTSGIYMEEFHDTASKSWMMRYLGYEGSGFPDSDWRQYIEPMIELDQCEIHVLTKPPQSFKRNQRTRESYEQKARDSKYMMQYTQNIQPRKIAHGLVQVIENIAKEVVLDLHCVRNENIEAQRFASEWVTNGHEEALKTRKLTRYVMDSSTPGRDKNFHEMSVLVTNLAIDLTKAELKKQGDASSLASVKYLDAFLEEHTAGLNALEPQERMLQEARGPRSLIENLYYRGLTENVVELDGAQVSVLRLGQRLLERRLQTAATVINVVGDMAVFARGYYVMIKDAGGFKRFDLTEKAAKPIMVNVDDLAEDVMNGGNGALAEGAASQSSAVDSEMFKAPLNNAEADVSSMKDETMSWSKDSASVADSKAAPEFEDFGSDGPVMM